MIIVFLIFFQVQLLQPPLTTDVQKGVHFPLYKYHLVYRQVQTKCVSYQFLKGTKMFVHGCVVALYRQQALKMHTCALLR